MRALTFASGSVRLHGTTRHHAPRRTAQGPKIRPELIASTQMMLQALKDHQRRPQFQFAYPGAEVTVGRLNEGLEIQYTQAQESISLIINADGIIQNVSRSDDFDGPLLEQCFQSPSTDEKWQLTTLANELLAFARQYQTSILEKHGIKPKGVSTLKQAFQEWIRSSLEYWGYPRR